MMNKNNQIIFLIIIQAIIATSSYDLDLECQSWQNEHIFLAKDVHFKNNTFPFVKLNTLDNLNLNMSCPFKLYSIQVLKIFITQPCLVNKSK